MKMFGKGEQVETLETSMNKAAEKAVPQAQAILVDAVKNMSVTDAKGILSGGARLRHPVPEQEQP